MKKNKFIIILFILFLSIGFAVLTSNLTMYAHFSFSENTFDLHFEKIETLNTSTVTSPTATITNETSISFNGTFNVPGDYIEFSFYIVNSGTIDGQINLISTNLTEEQKDYIDYNFKYAIDNSIVNLDDIIYAGQARKVIAHFEYKEDIDDFIDASSLSLNMTMKFIQPHIVTTTVWNYEYAGTSQYFIVPKNGTYKLELWGASGGGVDNNNIGYGGYATGSIVLKKNDIYYIYVGGAGKNSMSDSTQTASIVYGGWNGGGSGYLSKDMESYHSGGGGGSTDIRTIEAEVTYQNHSYYTDNENSLLSRIIVAGGGGGQGHGSYSNPPSSGAHGGGYIGNTVTSTWNDSHTHPQGGTQSSITFGYGSSPIMQATTTHLDTGNTSSFCSGGGGGGYYGGEASIYQGCRNFGGAGGSGYIGYSQLKDKIMYCYNCQESTNEADETNIKTRSTTNVSQSPISQYAKIGNGYARITYLG